MFSTKLSAYLIITTLLLSVGCNEPCVELSTRLCKCEATEALQQACTQAIKTEASKREANNLEQEICEGYLDQDDCQEETICEDNNARVCGLSSPASGLND